MNHTSKYNEGYRYYVYCGPGHIEYFKELIIALDYVKNNGGKLGQVT
jgi:hypothetical protein